MKQNIYYKGRVYEMNGDEIPATEQGLLKYSSYPYTGTNLKDGQVVVENVDYVLEHQYKSVNGEWFRDGKHIGDDSNLEKRTISIPKENIEVKETQEDKKEELQWLLRRLCQQGWKGFTYNEIVKATNAIHSSTRK